MERMWTRCAFALLLPACYQHSRVQLDAASADAPAADAEHSGCWSRWLEHQVMIASAMQLKHQQGNDRAPWISNDDLRLYYAHQAEMGSTQLAWSYRELISDDFLAGTPLLAGAKDAQSNLHAALTSDEKTLVWSSNRAGNGFKTYLNHRSDITRQFDDAMTKPLLDTNPASEEATDPFISADGKRLYLAPGPRGQQRIVLASRPDAEPETPFGALVPVMPDDQSSDDADPALSPDEQVIVFSSTRKSSGAPADWNLWYATKNSDGVFGSPVQVPAINLPDVDEITPMLSVDGCKLYFSRVTPTETDGQSHNGALYVATVAP